jgi:hypothetical protein
MNNRGNTKHSVTMQQDATIHFYRLISPESRFTTETNEQTIQYFIQIFLTHRYELKKNSVTRVRERTIPTERQPLVGEVSANFCG